MSLETTLVICALLPSVVGSAVLLGLTARHAWKKRRTCIACNGTGYRTKYDSNHVRVLGSCLMCKGKGEMKR